MKQILHELEKNGLQRGVHTAEQVSIVMRKLAEAFPFENFDVLNRREVKITPDFIREKMLKERRGGLCYELNALLLLLLKELGFSATIGIGTVRNEQGWATDRTHAFVLLQMEGTKYIADSGFGNKLALYPLKLNGPSVTSPAGSFRVRRRKTAKGVFALEYLNPKGEWDILYAFDWQPQSWSELERIKEKIYHHPYSAFNKRPIIAMVRPDCTESLNDERLFRKYTDGREEEMTFASKEEFLNMLRTLFPGSITKEAEKRIT